MALASKSSARRSWAIIAILLREAFREALDRVELVISSGGLGPTQDDLTRETVADLLGRRLQRNDTILHYIEAAFAAWDARCRS